MYYSLLQEITACFSLFQSFTLHYRYYSVFQTVYGSVLQYNVLYGRF